MRKIFLDFFEAQIRANRPI